MERIVVGSGRVGGGPRGSAVGPGRGPAAERHRRGRARLAPARGDELRLPRPDRPDSVRGRGPRCARRRGRGRRRLRIPAIEGRLVPGGAACVLVEEAKGAALLVVGSRGRAGSPGSMLGSVSQQVAHHAPCPVVIIPPAA